MRPPTVHVPEPTEAEIQKEAYRLWLESSQLAGRDLDNWLAARELLRHRTHVVANAHDPRSPKKTAATAAKRKGAAS